MPATMINDHLRNWKICFNLVIYCSAYEKNTTLCNDDKLSIYFKSIVGYTTQSV